VALEAILNEILDETELIPGNEMCIQIVVDVVVEISSHRRTNMFLASALRHHLD
jgi:hypothetical protein